MTEMTDIELRRWAQGKVNETLRIPGVREWLTFPLSTEADSHHSQQQGGQTMGQIEEKPAPPQLRLMPCERRGNRRLRNAVLTMRLAENKLLGHLPSISAEDIAAMLNKCIEELRE